MPHPIIPAARSTRRLTRLAAVLSLLLLAAGCRSAQSAYQFRPASAVAVTDAELRLATTEAPAFPEIGSNQPAGPVLVVPPTPASQMAVAQKMKREAGPAPLRQLHRRAGRAQAASVAYAAAHPRQNSHSGGAQGTAEVGLGTTVLGVLGLVVGPIALLGLLIWGGPVWAVLAALAALAVLVAYIDPFQ
ncbi:hypothetical protein CDA63_04245 [Hymenobacter amundsenii]|uniref:Uncharacterized protein n=1 Tax=Hymenobacter amundsenii TaxID=2006685 RepID=A0A246FNB2_9BACT|nr:hypothetical protein [Hymenobacter amundsenii]OWP64256.1 hypothetical protein CDA63_04245 [Hymenobacter amundsenii]